MNKMISLLKDYIAVLKEVEIRPDAPHETAAHRYHIPSDIVSSEDWGEFDNVYQIHCPSIFMDNAVRDVRSSPCFLRRFFELYQRLWCSITIALATEGVSNIIWQQGTSLLTSHIVSNPL